MGATTPLGGPRRCRRPGSQPIRTPGIRVHNPRQLHPEDRDRIDGIPVTSIHRALLDYAEVATPQELRLAIEAAERRELFDLRKLEVLLARSPGRRGLKPLRRILKEMAGSVAWTRSELENAFLALIREHRIPEPLVNVIVEGYLVDIYWPRSRLIAEVDSYGFHKSRATFNSDRKRDTKLQIARYPVVRITQPRVEHEPEELVSDIRQLLSRPSAPDGHWR